MFENNTPFSHSFHKETNSSPNTTKESAEEQGGESTKKEVLDKNTSWMT
jgi:hypothetical protein